MAKMKSDTTSKKKAVNMQNSNGKSATNFGEVANNRIDSLKKAQPGLNLKGSRDRNGGIMRYKDSESDKIKAGLKKSTQAAIAAKKKK